MSRFSGSELYLDALEQDTWRTLESAGISAARLRALAGSDNTIATTAELCRLFALIDTLDTNGSARSLVVAHDSEPNQPPVLTPAGEALAALGRERRVRHKVLRDDFIQEHVQGVINLGVLASQEKARLAALGLDLDAMDALANEQGHINGYYTLYRLFLLIDRLDFDGTYRSVDSTVPIRDTDSDSPEKLEAARTPAGEVIAILQRCYRPFDQPFVGYTDLSRAAQSVDPACAAQSVDPAYAAQSVQPAAVELDVPHVTQKGSRGCYRAAVDMIARFDRDLSLAGQLYGYDRALVMARSEGAGGEIAGWRADFVQGRAYIDRCLQAGRPALVGVSHSVRQINHDRMTDHFIVIIGRGTDEHGRLFYSYNDPATGGPFGRGRLYVDRDTSLLFRPPLSERVGSFFARAYQVTQVRVYRDL